MTRVLGARFVLRARVQTAAANKPQELACCVVFDVAMIHRVGARTTMLVDYADKCAHRDFVNPMGDVQKARCVAIDFVDADFHFVCSSAETQAQVPVCVNRIGMELKRKSPTNSGPCWGLYFFPQTAE
jgi:hypothetical protein